MTCCSNPFKIEVMWPGEIATSNWFPPLVYLIFQGILAIVFVAFQILHIADNSHLGAFYAIFLTHWALVLQTITMVLLFISTAWGYTKLPDGPSQGQAPLFVRYTVAFWYLIQPTSLIVVILYWTLINPIFNDPFLPELSSLWAHLLNWLCLLVSLFASRIPWSFKNSIWGLLFTVAYGIWTLIHFFLQIGRGFSCDLYPDPECPIYDEFDWNMPGITTLIVLATVVVYGVVALLYTGLFRCRDSCSPAMTISDADASGKEAETKDEPENGA